MNINFFYKHHMKLFVRKNNNLTLDKKDTLFVFERFY